MVVFAAGNSGYGEAEMGLNPFSQSPWVISVAASTLDHERGDFSPNGLIHDNAQAVPVDRGGHTVFTGDRIGVYHPDVTAPGAAISSTCTPTSTAATACPPPGYGNRNASGTSMASPHVAGAAAVLLQANPQLTPTQVRLALQATANPVLATDANGDPVPQSELPFWQVGCGHVDLNAAVKLVRRPDWSSRLARRAQIADARVLADDGFAVARSDFWTYDAPRVAVAVRITARSRPRCPPR